MPTQMPESKKPKKGFYSAAASRRSQQNRVVPSAHEVNLLRALRSGKRKDARADMDVEVYRDARMRDLGATDLAVRSNSSSRPPG